MDAIISGVSTVVQAGERGRWQQICFGRNPVKTLKRVLVWSVSTVFVFHTLLVPIQIIGTSMTPTYRDRSYNLVNKFAYLRSQPRRQDVIALQADGELLLKRIVALPGEKVAIHNRALQVNGRRLEDSFATRKIPWEMKAMNLGADEYFVIGDNRGASVFRKIDKTQIVGKIIF